jgi:hypothetical protein
LARVVVTREREGEREERAGWEANPALTVKLNMFVR